MPYKKHKRKDGNAMPKYKVTIIETLEKEVIIEAENEDIAREKVRADWSISKHILSADNFTGVSFSVYLADRDRGNER